MLKNLLGKKNRIKDDLQTMMINKKDNFEYELNDIVQVEFKVFFIDSLNT